MPHKNEDEFTEETFFNGNGESGEVSEEENGEVLTDPEFADVMETETETATKIPEEDRTEPILIDPDSEPAPDEEVDEILGVGPGPDSTSVSVSVTDTETASSEPSEAGFSFAGILDEFASPIEAFNEVRNRLTGEREQLSSRTVNTLALSALALALFRQGGS